MSTHCTGVLQQSSGARELFLRQRNISNLVISNLAGLSGNFPLGSGSVLIIIHCIGRVTELESLKRCMGIMIILTLVRVRGGKVGWNKCSMKFKSRMNGAAMRFLRLE